MKLNLDIFTYASSLVLGGCALLTLPGCDNIDPDDRFIPVERPTVERIVLVQEFTGQSCVNCPDGAQTIHDLQATFPGSVIAVCFHPEGTPFTAPIGYDLGLTSPQATEYFNFYKPNGFPAAIVNGSSLLYNIGQWSTAVSSALSTPAPADIHLSLDYNSANRELKADWNVKFNEIYNHPASVQLWIMENGIVGPQLSSKQGLIPAYTHNHVFRACLNGLWGEKIGETFLPEQTLNGTSVITLDQSWKPENLQVVAFIYKTSSREVEQATQADVIPSAE